VEIGGTFTDLVAWRDAGGVVEVIPLKVPSATGSVARR
jgi:N-methylhydantoinase A/oxoprolinase/acetone carboxylase beta subunit